MINLEYDSSLRLIAFLAVGFFVSWGTISFILRLWGKYNHSMDRGRDFHHTNKVPVPRYGG
ncbi:MAG TPA: hypothetical protein VGC39_12205, partial [Candidatus Methylacidiphilales bacterium]